MWKDCMHLYTAYIRTGSVNIYAMYQAQDVMVARPICTTRTNKRDWRGQHLLNDKCMSDVAIELSITHDFRTIGWANTVLDSPYVGDRSASTAPQQCSNLAPCKCYWSGNKMTGPHFTELTTIQYVRAQTVSQNIILTKTSQLHAVLAGETHIVDPVYFWIHGNCVKLIPLSCLWRFFCAY